ncbi:MAG: hypothetical protein U1E60_10920 [Reyranellaceae bacterium]
MQQMPKTIEGQVVSVYISGFASETSHQCQIKLKPDTGDEMTVLLAHEDNNYRSMLGALLSARLGRCHSQVSLDSTDPRFIESVSVQKAREGGRPMTEPGPPPIISKTIPSSLVQSLDAGIDGSRSSFKLTSGETVFFDSIQNPKRSRAMMQLVAAAFGAAAMVAVVVVDDGKGNSIAQSVEVAP